MINGYLAPYAGLFDSTPTIPKFYWDVKSQEQRIKIMCYLIQGLVDNYASTDSQIQKNAADIKELQDRFQQFVEHGFDEYYEQQVIEWISQHIELVYDKLARQVYFGLTSDGYFCAYVPDSWSEVTFDTGAVYGTQEYGRLILRFDADGHGIIDNTGYDASVLTDTIDSRLKAVAGDGLNYANDQLNVNVADQVTFGGVHLTHAVENKDEREYAVTSDGVYAYAPSKSETVSQPEGNAVTNIMDGVGVTLTSVSRSGGIVMFRLDVEVTAGHTLNAYTNVCTLPSWCGSGSGLTIAPSPFAFVSNGGNLQSTKSVPAGSTVSAFMTCEYKG